MSTRDWPTALVPQTFSASLRKAGLQFRSPFNGTTQAVDFLAERWVFSLTLPPRRKSSGGAVESFLFNLAGGVERVLCPHFGRPVPLGTMRGSPVLSSQITRGATSLPITTTPGATIKAGDMLGAGGQLFMVIADAGPADGAGSLQASVLNRVRATINAGAAVTWDAPTATFIMPAMAGAVSFRPAILDSVPIDLEEVW